MRSMIRTIFIILLMTAVSLMIGCDKVQTKKGSTEKKAPVAQTVDDKTEAKSAEYFYEISAGAKNIYIGKDYQWKVSKVNAETGDRSKIRAKYSSEDPKVLEVSEDGLAMGRTSEYTAVNIGFEGLTYRAEVLVLDPAQGEPADGGIGLQNPVYLNSRMLMHSWLIREEVRGSDKYIEIYVGLENLGDESIRFNPKEFRLIDDDDKPHDPIPPEPDPESDPDAYNEISNAEVVKGDMNFGEVAFRLPADGPAPRRFEYRGQAGAVRIDYTQLTQMYQ